MELWEVLCIGVVFCYVGIKVFDYIDFGFFFYLVWNGIFDFGNVYGVVDCLEFVFGIVECVCYEEYFVFVVCKVE